MKVLCFLLSIADESQHEKIEYLYTSFHSDMIKYAKYRLNSCGISNYEEDAQDVVQNAFVKIVKYTHAIDFTVGDRKLRAYMLAIVTNEVNNFLNDIDLTEPLDDTLPDDDFFPALQVSSRYDEVVAAIERLDDRYSIALLYRYRENMSIKELATLLGIAEKSVYTRIERGRKLLLKSLGKEK